MPIPRCKEWAFAPPAASNGAAHWDHKPGPLLPRMGESGRPTVNCAAAPQGGPSAPGSCEEQDNPWNHLPARVTFILQSFVLIVNSTPGFFNLLLINTPLSPGRDLEDQCRSSMTGESPIIPASPWTEKKAGDHRNDDRRLGGGKAASGCSDATSARTDSCIGPSPPCPNPPGAQSAGPPS